MYVCMYVWLYGCMVVVVILILINGHSEFKRW